MVPSKVAGLSVGSRDHTWVLPLRLALVLALVTGIGKWLISPLTGHTVRVVASGLGEGLWSQGQCSAKISTASEAHSSTRGPRPSSSEFSACIKAPFGGGDLASCQNQLNWSGWIGKKKTKQNCQGDKESTKSSVSLLAWLLINVVEAGIPSHQLGLFPLRCRVTCC